MDGCENAITGKEHKTDAKVTNIKSEVKLKRASNNEKNVTSVPTTPVLQKDGKDGTHSSPEAAVLGVRRDASASPIRSRPGGWTVEVRGPNPASGSGQLHAGKPNSTAPKNCQPHPMTENNDVRRPRCLPAADDQQIPAGPTPAPRSTPAENVRPKLASCSDSQKNTPTTPKPARNSEPPKPAPRSSIVKPDKAETTSRSSTDNAETHNAPKPAPRSSASLLISTSRPDDAARMESRSNHQFIADENLSVWSSSTQIERPLSTENICRICHESDQVEPLISPCLCRGTLSLVHRTCLQHWLAESDSSSCELCRFIYITKRVPKYSILGSVVAWISQNRRQRKALLVDTLGMIAFVPFATMITYVAAALADGIEYQESGFHTYTLTEKNRVNFIVNVRHRIPCIIDGFILSAIGQPSWTDVTIRFAIVTFISMMTTIDVAYATYWMLRAQHHFSSWYSWYRRNSDVTLLPHPQ